uniref:Uncharacterized protein n=1 Tax=Aegilops tauschii subsp. strangulata TaxID=200361 RepID=A0A453J2Z2_AEGTS
SPTPSSRPSPPSPTQSAAAFSSHPRLTSRRFRRRPIECFPNCSSAVPPRTQARVHPSSSLAWFRGSCTIQSGVGDQLMSGSASIQTGRRPVHRGESPDCPRETLDPARVPSPPPRPVLARLSSRGWSRTRRPSPRTRPRTAAPWTAGRGMTASPLPYGAQAECPEVVDPPPCRRFRGHVSTAASACATLNDDCACPSTLCLVSIDCIVICF